MPITFKPKKNLNKLHSYLKSKSQALFKSRTKRSKKAGRNEPKVFPETIDQREWHQKFSELKIESPLQDSLKFKARLEIGEKAFTSLRIKTLVEDVWDSAGAGISGAGIAGVLGSKGFFGTTGILGLLGIGTAATPLTVIIAAGVVSGVGWRLLRGYLRSFSEERILSIPKYLNTPLDILAVGIFDLLAILSLKVAKKDGMINNLEFDKIVDYFVNQWGYSQKFVEAGISYLFINLDTYDTKKTAQEFAAYLKENPDCNFKAISKGTTDFLEELASVEEFGFESKDQEIQKIKEIFAIKNSYFEKFMSQITPTRDLKGYLKIFKQVK